MSNNIAIPDSVTQSLADKPEIYQRFFIPAATCIFHEYVNNQDLADILIEAHDFDSELFPQFRYDLSRVTRKDEGRLKDIHGCIESAEKGNWRDREMSLEHHNKLNRRDLEDDEKARFMLEAKTEGLSCQKLVERVEEYLVREKGKVPKERAKNEVQEALERAWELLRKCREFIEQEGGEIAENLVDDIDACLLGQ